MRAGSRDGTGRGRSWLQEDGEAAAGAVVDGDVLELAAELARRLIARDDEPTRLPPPSELDAALDLRPPEDSRSLGEVADRLARLLEFTPSTSGRRFFNQLFAGRDEAALLGELVAVIANTSPYTYKAAGAQVLAERALISHMGHKVGWQDCGGLFTPGGSLSNFAAMVVARNERLEGVRETGLDGRPVAMYISAEAHYSMPKNAGMLGIGRRNVRSVATDTEGRMLPSALEAAIQQDLDAGVIPLMVVATSGTTVQGAFDPLDALAEVTRSHGVWLHVDGAYGGTLLLSGEHRHLLRGSELADSFTWDAHKMMGVPLTCSVALFRDAEMPHKHFDETATYLFQRDDAAYNPGRSSLQCGRRNDALKLWTAWQRHGDAGYERRIARQFQLAAYARSVIESEPRFTLVKRPQSVNLCFTVDGVDAREVCHVMDRAGRARVSHGTVDGVPTVRLVCLNPDLVEADLDEFFDHVRWAADQLLSGSAEG
ncbi:MAG: pyridoxal phosphate-dependent decarboxylase family protein [Phycisphaerales bacterium JB041]